MDIKQLTLDNDNGLGLQFKWYITMVLHMQVAFYIHLIMALNFSSWKDNRADFAARLTLML